MQNAAKHAGERPRVSVSLTAAADRLRFSVTDDGAGFEPGETCPGQGLGNMAARIEAVGGELVVQAAPGHGTRVAGSVPLATRLAAT
jgi:signal transduction histidine kinase